MSDVVQAVGRGCEVGRKQQRRGQRRGAEGKAEQLTSTSLNSCIMGRISVNIEESSESATCRQKHAASPSSIRAKTELMTREEVSRLTIFQALVRDLTMSQVNFVSN